jgi:hypothetical protein
MFTAEPQRTLRSLFVWLHFQVRELSASVVKSISSRACLVNRQKQLFERHLHGHQALVQGIANEAL